jgi:hypothetical protein
MIQHDHIYDYPVAANTVIRHGAPVLINASGYAIEGTAAGTGQKIVGVAGQYVDNSSGANGAARVSVFKTGIVRCTLASGSGITQASIGNTVYLDGFDATNVRPTIHGSATGRTALGTLVDLIGGVAFVRLNTV